MTHQRLPHGEHRVGTYCRRPWLRFFRLPENRETVDRERKPLPPPQLILKTRRNLQPYSGEPGRLQVL
ncbi:hypothetical protein CesoFtcFv8_017970 [Champsocephalus esox]|uniref:Uncharacterized protein n=1 Tax=Champsocephalus esox TaxID=159716 RepID=A0AAN8BLI0_9TELE|nr:hypothetical protein CesoFtcFv8_017970 [Champsocephalus esox]